MPCWRSAGSTTSFRQAYCASTRRRVRSWMACSCSVIGQPIGAGLIRAELDPLLEAGDADLEELIEIVRRDAQELEPLEQRHFLVERLREHALVEFEQRQFAIDVVLGGAEIWLVHGAAIWFRAIKSQLRAD